MQVKVAEPWGGGGYCGSGGGGRGGGEGSGGHGACHGGDVYSHNTHGGAIHADEGTSADAGSSRGGGGATIEGDVAGGRPTCGGYVGGGEGCAVTGGCRGNDVSTTGRDGITCDVRNDDRTSNGCGGGGTDRRRVGCGSDGQGGGDGGGETSLLISWVPVAVVWGQGWQHKGTAHIAVAQWAARNGFKSFGSCMKTIVAGTCKRIVDLRMLPMDNKKVLRFGWAQEAMHTDMVRGMMARRGERWDKMTAAKRAEEYAEAMREQNFSTPLQWVSWWLMLGARAILSSGDGWGETAQTMVDARLCNLFSDGINGFHGKVMEVEVPGWWESCRNGTCLILMGIKRV